MFDKETQQLHEMRTQTKIALAAMREAQHARIDPAGYTRTGTPLSQSSVDTLPATNRNMQTQLTGKKRLTSSGLLQDPAIDRLFGMTTGNKKNSSRAMRHPAAFNTSPRIDSTHEKPAMNNLQSLTRAEIERLRRRSPSPIFQFHNERLKYNVKSTLEKDDEYYRNIQQFRVSHPNLCINEVEAKRPERKADLYKHPPKPDNTVLTTQITRKIEHREKDINVHTTGFFAINDRLFPERVQHSPFMGDRGLSAAEEPPVK
ncbi:hypothetical protein HK100_010891 [Physocladia obscura]|uniref:Uncharacterized protein n=1 Tax=Physocladia obscura TaxID=109957 RepID=A0AAD5XGZ5_9FUNG|nr:hypothetical protein HK100_010891 [Physocladia obscura]